MYVSFSFCLLSFFFFFFKSASLFDTVKILGVGTGLETSHYSAFFSHFYFSFPHLSIFVPVSLISSARICDRLAREEPSGVRGVLRWCSGGGSVSQGLRHCDPSGCSLVPGFVWGPSVAFYQRRELGDCSASPVCAPHPQLHSHEVLTALPCPCQCAPVEAPAPTV